MLYILTARCINVFCCNLEYDHKKDLLTPLNEVILFATLQNQQNYKQTRNAIEVDPSMGRRVGYQYCITIRIQKISSLSSLNSFSTHFSPMFHLYTP